MIILELLGSFPSIFKCLVGLRFVTLVQYFPVFLSVVFAAGTPSKGTAEDDHEDHNKDANRSP